MPVITFGKQHLDEGFLFLAKRGEVGCLPDDIFVIAEPLFDLLEQSGIPFTRVQRDFQRGDAGAQSEKQRTTDGKVSV